MKKLLTILLMSTLLVCLCLFSHAASNDRDVIVTGDLSTIGTTTFVLNSNSEFISHYTFGTGKYYKITSCYLGDIPLFYEYEGNFIEHLGEYYYSTVIFKVSSSSLLDAYSRGDSIFLTVEGPSYSAQHIDFVYLSDDGYNLSNESFISRLQYNELSPLADQQPLIPYYVTYSDSNFIYTYRFDSAFFDVAFPGVTLTYSSTLHYVDGDSYIKLKFNDYENSSLLYNSGVKVKVVYSLMDSAPVGSADSMAGGSANDVNDAFYFFTYLGFLGTVPYNVISPAFDVEIFGVNILFAFNCLISVVLIVFFVFLIIKVVT